MVMEEVFEKLRSLQDILSQKILLEKDILEAPKILTTQEELLSRLKKTYIDRNSDYEKANSARIEYRELLAQAEANRERAERNMDNAIGQREYEALDKEIKDATEKEQQYRRELQKEERLLTDIDEQMKQQASLIEQQELDLAEKRSSLETEIFGKTQQVRELETLEHELDLVLDPEILFKFERIIRNKMGKGIVAIRGGVCTGCHMILPAQFANQVHLGEEIVFCPYCSRILFYEEAELGEEVFFDSDDSSSVPDQEDIDEDDYEDEEEEDDKVNIDYDD